MKVVDFVNKEYIICQNLKVTAINSCIEVDIVGNVRFDWNPCLLRIWRTSRLLARSCQRIGRPGKTHSGHALHYLEGHLKDCQHPEGRGRSHHHPSSSTLSGNGIRNCISIWAQHSTTSARPDRHCPPRPSGSLGKGCLWTTKGHAFCWLMTLFVPPKSVTSKPIYPPPPPSWTIG